MKNVKEEAEKLARPFADELGLEIVEVEYVRKHNGMNLTFFIDKEGGVTIDDCEKLHRAIDEPLDILDGKKRIVGVLEKYDKEGFCIRTEKGGLVEIKYSAAASVKPVIKF